MEYPPHKNVSTKKHPVKNNHASLPLSAGGRDEADPGGEELRDGDVTWANAVFGTPGGDKF